ncbi:MAG: tetratricopeptide repeat protein [Vicinamibacterales bacterium]
MTETTPSKIDVELMKAKLEAHKKDKLLHLVSGLFAGLLIGFFGANWINGRPAAMTPSDTAAAADSGDLPPDHPAVGGGGGGGGAAMPEVQAKLKAADDNPSDYDAQMEAAAMYFRINNFPKSVEYLQRASKLKPDDPETYANLARVQLRNGESDQAITSARKAYDLKPDDFDNTVLLANLMFDTQRFAEAQPLYEKALGMKPDDVDVRTDLGTSYFKAGNPDKAIATYRESLKRNPKHENTLVNMAHVAISSGDVATAEDALTKLAAVNAQNTELASLRGELDQLKKTGKIPTH